MKNLALLALLPLCLASCERSIAFDTHKGESYAYVEKSFDTSTAKGLNYESALVPFDFEQFQIKLEYGSASLILLTQASCSHCATLEPTFASVAKQYGVECYGIHDQEITLYVSFLRALSDSYAEILSDLYTPMLLLCASFEKAEAIDLKGLYRDEDGLAKKLGDAANYVEIYNVRTSEAYEFAKQSQRQYVYSNDEEYEKFYQEIYPDVKDDKEPYFLISQEALN